MGKYVRSTSSLGTQRMIDLYTPLQLVGASDSIGDNGERRRSVRFTKSADDLRLPQPLHLDVQTPPLEGTRRRSSSFGKTLIILRLARMASEVVRTCAMPALKGLSRLPIAAPGSRIGRIHGVRCGDPIDMRFLLAAHADLDLMQTYLCW